jgi:hypothetical protein
MKKLFFGLILLVILAISCIYIFIPTNIKISQNTFFTVPGLSLIRGINDYKKWNEWWPVDSSAHINLDQQKYNMGGLNYEPYQRTDKGVAVSINLKDSTIISFINVLNYTGDSTILEWQACLNAGLNPIIRLKKYFQAVTIKKNMDTLLKSFRLFTQDTKNIYGYHIERTTFMDTLFLVNKFELNHYPGTGEIYAHINALRHYVKSKGAVAKDYSMLNVDIEDSFHFAITVAININKVIPEQKPFLINTMPINHNGTLVANVTGANDAVEKAHTAIRNYMRDYMIQIKAMSFDMLINDRSKIPDSTQWETIIYYPCTPN